VIISIVFEEVLVENLVLDGLGEEYVDIDADIAGLVPTLAVPHERDQSGSTWNKSQNLRL
jgi:hypothetical protein